MPIVMRTLLAASLIASGISVTAPPARADNGNVAAGILGGLMVGTFIGAATAPRYYAPAPVYVEAPPPMVVRECYWTLSQPMWDRYRGAWVRSRVQVCD